jgi:thimet oligopeptidase
MLRRPKLIGFSTTPPEWPDENCDILYGMKAMLTAVFLLLSAGAALAQAPPDVAQEAPFYVGVSDAESLRAFVEQRTARADAYLKALLDAQGARTIENTLVPYDRMGMENAGAFSVTRIVARLHPDERMRTTAEELGQALATKIAALALRPDIYSALRAIDLRTADPATKGYVTRELRDLELAGVNKPEDVRARLTRLQSELQAAQQEFSRNLLSGQRRLAASASEIEGLPPDFIAARKPDASGSITLTTDDVDMQVVSSYARNAALRKRHLIERFNVAAPGNVKVLERLLATRYEIATLLGYPMWAEYHARSRMAGDAKTVADFIDRVFAASTPAATREYAELLARKKQDVPDATTLESWDRTYYAELVRRARYSFDSQSVRPYFPYERVRAGVMDVSSRLFGVTFRPAPSLPTWHPSVESYEVLQEGTLIGRLYLDVHPRAQKANSGASVASVRRGARGVHIPEAVLTASVPGGVPGDPGLMTHDQVRTMFHEFGHVIHAIVGGQGRWHGINGIDIEGDVAEAPSTMLEEWIWDAPTLATFARHYQTDQPIPADLVQQMRRAGEFGRGLDAQRQAFLSKVSLSLHDKSQSVVDSTAVVRDVSLKYNNMYPWMDGTYFQAQFTHLANGLYTSSYYTYLWSRVVAKDLFSQFDRANLLAPAVAHRYRDAVLVPGGSKPAADLIGDFLGRPFRFDAYERWLNGEGASATN